MLNKKKQKSDNVRRTLAVLPSIKLYYVYSVDQL